MKNKYNEKFLKEVKTNWSRQTDPKSNFAIGSVYFNLIEDKYKIFDGNHWKTVELLEETH